MPRVAVAIALPLVLLLVMLETPTQPFGRQQAPQKNQIALAVLRAHRARRKLLGNVEIEAHLRVVGQQFHDHVAHVLVLEEVAVAAQAEQRQRGFQPQAVARQAAVRAQPGRLGAHAVPGAAAAVRLQQADRQLFAEEQGQVEVGRGAERVDLEAEQVVDRLVSGEAFGGKRFGQRAVLGGTEGDQVRMLAEASAEQAERARFGREIHGSDTIGKTPSQS